MKTGRSWFLAAAGAVALANLPMVASAVAQSGTDPAAAAAATLPGGATALSETHGDWTVNCRIIGTAKICSLSHQQFDKSNNQRLLAIELASASDKEARGSLAMPFGLALAKGIAMQVDEQKVEGMLPFSTCLVVGCIAPITFDAALIGQLKAGSVLKLEGIAAETNQPVNFTISLRGFGSALARTAELSGS